MSCWLESVFQFQSFLPLLLILEGSGDEDSYISVAACLLLMRTSGRLAEQVKVVGAASTYSATYVHTVL